MSLKLQGVFPPIPTSFDADGKILHDRLKTNLERWSQTGIHGFAVLGTNGEYVFLNEAEKAAVWETARAAIPRDKFFLAGARGTCRQVAHFARAQWPGDHPAHPGIRMRDHGDAHDAHPWE